MQGGEGDRQGVPARVAQDAPPYRGNRGRAHPADFPLKVAVIAGPFQSPATAQTRQVYSSPPFTFIFGVQVATFTLAGRHRLARLLVSRGVGNLEDVAHVRSILVGDALGLEHHRRVRHVAAVRRFNGQRHRTQFRGHLVVGGQLVHPAGNRIGVGLLGLRRRLADGAERLVAAGEGDRLPGPGDLLQIRPLDPAVLLLAGFQ